MCCLIIMSIVEPLFCSGISTPYGEVVVENIVPGEDVSITGIANKPFSVKNNSENRVRIKIDVVVPQETELKPGYVALPDSSWIKLDKDTFDLEAGEEAITQVVLQVPNKKKFYGKKYQVYLWSRTLPKESGMSISVGLKSRFLLETVKKKSKKVRKS